MADVKHTPVTEWVGDFKLMADFLATIEDSAHHNNNTKDWSDRLCDCAFFAQRVAHVMLDLQPKYEALLAALKEVVDWHGRRDPHDDELSPASEQEEEIAQAMRAIAKAEGQPHG